MNRVLTFITGSVKKLEEVQKILGGNFPLKVLALGRKLLQ